MTVIRIGLVAEGITDQVVLENLVGAYFRTARPDVTLQFKNLQPSPDGTSGDKEGGWELVYKWCLNNTPEIRRSQFFGGGLFADDMDALECDLILVHLDADICGVIGDKSHLPPLADAATAEDKGVYLSNTIHLWLWPSGEAEDDRHYTAPAVESVETWLVAALSEDASPESNQTVLRRLVEIDFGLKGKECPPEAKKINKSKNNYIRVARKAAENVATLPARCPHFGYLASSLSEALTRLSPPAAHA